MKGSFFLTAVAGSLGAVSAQAEDAAAPAPVTDPNLIALHYQQVFARPEFQNATDPDVNSQLRDWLSQGFLHFGAKFDEFKYASNIPGIASLILTLFVFLVLAGLLYLGLRLSRRQGNWSDVTPALATGNPALPPPEFYDEEIRQALGRADWHAAWLSTWRQFLSRMERAHLVEADRTQTNREYLSQLQSRPLPASAAALLPGMVDAYDRFIYGSEKIGEQDWISFQAQVHESALLLHLNDDVRADKMP